MKFLALPLSFVFSLFSVIVLAQTRSVALVGVSSDPNKSIITNTQTSNNHKTLLTALKAADLEKILSYDGPFTVFAPSDKAFEKLSDAEIQSLLDPDNKKKLQDILTYHIVAGNFSAANILRAMSRGNGKATFTTVQGDKITTTMSGVDIILTDALGQTARITIADANQCNGVIHEIDNVILPNKI